MRPPVTVLHSRRVEAWHRFRRPAALLLLALVLGSCASQDSPLERGAVAAPEPEAAIVGAKILERGGNAVDAAIAVQFALCVTNALGAGIGGGGFMLIHDPASSEDVVALDYRETAPAAAHRDLFLDEEGEVVPELSVHSALAAAIPGTVRGMGLAHERYGSLPWADLLAPAIELAEKGFVIDDWTANSFDKFEKEFEEVGARFREQIEFALYYDGDSGEALAIPTWRRPCAGSRSRARTSSTPAAPPR